MVGETIKRADLTTVFSVVGSVLAVALTILLAFWAFLGPLRNDIHQLETRLDGDINRLEDKVGELSERVAAVEATLKALLPGQANGE